MDTCTNCGANLRPGAKFCTTCGTRLNEMPAASNEGWTTPRSFTSDDNQETSVIPSIQSQESSPISAPGRTAANSWSNAYGGSSSSSNDPASRFISALDSDVESVDDTPVGTTTESESTWGSPAPVFTPPPPSNWSYSSEDSESKSPEPDGDTPAESTWETPSTWAEINPAEEHAEEIDAAGFTDDGKGEVDYLSGDENIETSGESSVSLAPDDAREKAIALADELRRTIRMMDSGGESDHGAAVMALTEASLYVSDFSDVRGVLAEVKNDPRDIETLGNLAARADRLEKLLVEHRSLAEAIETAIRELNG